MIFIGIGWLLIASCIGLVVMWLSAAAVIRAGRRVAPPLEECKGTISNINDDESPLPRISVIIPAHNEELLLAEALHSILASDYPQLEIIVVADRCTDRTVEIARGIADQDDRLQVFELDECPEGWSGKCHTCWHGYQKATGDYLLFTDADTLFAPTLISKSLTYMHGRSLDFLSLLGQLRFEHPFERTAQPIAAMALMRMYPLTKANREETKDRRPFANGQFMLFKREVYESIGTHEGLRNAILEDLRFARRLTRYGFRIGVTFAGSLFTVRMYETIDEFRRGWKRIMIEGANRNSPRLRSAAWRLRFLAVSPLVILATIIVGIIAWPTDMGFGIVALVAGLGSAITQLVVLKSIYALQGAPANVLLNFPRGCAQMGNLLMEAAEDIRLNRGIAWASLHYSIDENKEEKQE